MREIKFKFVVKTNDNIEVTEAYDLCDLMEWVNVLSEYSADEILHELQSTGLLDKQDVEIYEGDIVKYTDYNFCINDTRNADVYIGEVMWSHDSWALNVTEIEQLYTINSTVEVIGNIYENKDLLDELK